jgi:NTE family protein
LSSFYRAAPPPILLACLLLQTLILPGWCWGAAEAGRPRIGLVLGGGGARGAAHIGVLKELERLQVPVDAIVGTSMGAIVGGLYASGMTTAELEELVQTLDWKSALSDSGTREELSFRGKQDDEDFPIRFELGVRDGKLLLPQGVIQGQRLDLVLRELTIDSSHIDDFDELAIPFRAVASDLVSGDVYVMGEGDLALAIRASMSVPGAFAPVQVNGHLLADGGLVGNLGVEVIERMGVDVIIAVDVEFPLYPEEALLSAVGISEQVLTILMHKETLRQIERLDEDDVLIQPELGVFASTDFAGSPDAIEPGVIATRAMAGRLRELSVDDESFARYQARRRAVPPRKETIDFVRVDHDGRISTALLERRMAVEPGDPVDPELFANEASRLFGLRVFEKVGYQLVEEGDQLGVVFSATSKRWGPGYLRFGLAIEDDFEGGTSFNIAARYWRPGLNALGAEWRTDLQVGTDPGFATEFYQPLRGDSRLFVAPRLEAGQRNFNVFAAGEPVAQLRLTEYEVGVDAGAELGTWGEVRVGAYRGNSNARVKVGDPAVPNTDIATGGVRAQLLVDTLDDARFPRSGVQAGFALDLSRPVLGSDRSYDRAAFDVDSAWSRGKNTIVAGLQFGTSLNSQSTLQDHYTLGGFLRLSGLERGELLGPYAGLARLVYYRRIGDAAGGLFEMPVYIGASIESGNVWTRSDAIGFDSLLTNGSLFLGLDSYFGPVYIAAGMAEGGGTNFYLFVGATPR